MKKLLEKKLKILTKLALKKQRPKIVTITGSVGKTSTKEAIYNVLEKKFKVRRSVKNYNNEIGVPMTVVGEDSPGKNPFGWLKVFFKFFSLIFWKKRNYPEVLVLETAADKPGDLQYLMKMLPQGLLKVAVLTAVSESHLEFFGNLEGVFKEKIIPFFYLTENGFAVLNEDDCDLEKIKQKAVQGQTLYKFITYSLHKKADVVADNLRVEDKGVAFTIKCEGNSAEFLMEEAVSFHQVYAVLAGVCVGIALGMELTEILSGLKNYNILPGRMRKIKGIHESLIIDDTYNSSPVAALRALQALQGLPFGRRKIAVLGDMLEMGPQSEQLHRQIGRLAAELKIDYLFTFGKQAEFISKEAVTAGMRESAVLHFYGQLGLREHLEGFLQSGDVVLIKASQGMRLEKLVKALMESPERAPKLLVRQDKEWLKT